MATPAGALGASTFGSEPAARSHPWRWRLEDADGAELTDVLGAGQTFPSQSDAESWVGETWEDLREDGVEAVTLFEADRAVYGPMSLRPS